MTGAGVEEEKHKDARHTTRNRGRIVVKDKSGIEVEGRKQRSQWLIQERKLSPEPSVRDSSNVQNIQRNENNNSSIE